MKINKVISLDTLVEEMVAAGVDIGQGLTLFEDDLFPYFNNQPGSFPDEAAAQVVVDNHIATRPMSQDELATLYQLPQGQRTGGISDEEIQAMSSGLLPRPRVPIVNSPIMPT